MTALRRTVLGVCSDEFSHALPFNLLEAVAERVGERWVKHQNAAGVFEPQGRFWVPRDMCLDMTPYDVVACEVEDQPDWKGNLATRFRMVRRAEAPLELFHVPVASSSDRARTHLATQGVDGSPARADGEALVEFADGVVARLRLVPHPSVAGRSVARAADLASPIEAWPSAKGFPAITFTPNGRPRRFVVPVDFDAAPQYLDLATFEEIVAASARSGGLGSFTGPSAAELKKAREKLEPLTKAFEGRRWEARRKRIAQFLESVDRSATEREALAAYLEAHPAFRSAVGAAVAAKADELREVVRGELRTELADLDRELTAKTEEYYEAEQLLEAVKADLVAGDEEIERLDARRADLEGLAENLAASCSALTEELDARRAQLAAPQPPRPPDQPAPPALAWLPRTGKVVPVKGVHQAVGIVERNLEQLGIHPLSAKQVAYETVTAFTLGQVAFFSGPLARPVGEAVGLVASAASLRVVHVPLGGAEPLDLAADQPDTGAAVLIEGANRGCVDAWGAGLKRVVARRRLRLQRELLPVYLATLEDGPSALPVHPGLLDLGPVVDTSLLSWKPPAVEPHFDLGRFEPGTLAVPDGMMDKAEKEGWDDVLKGLGPAGGYWVGAASATVTRLTTMAKLVGAPSPALSFLCTWLLPWLVASGRPLTAYRETISAVLSLAGKKADPRVRSQLAAHGLGEAP